MVDARITGHFDPKPNRPRVESISAMTNANHPNAEIPKPKDETIRDNIRIITVKYYQQTHASSVAVLLLKNGRLPAYIQRTSFTIAHKAIFSIITFL